MPLLNTPNENLLVMSFLSVIWPIMFRVQSYLNQMELVSGQGGAQLGPSWAWLRVWLQL